MKMLQRIKKIIDFQTLPFEDAIRRGI